MDTISINGTTHLLTDGGRTAEAYVLLLWPDSQEWMDEEWWDEEAVLAFVDGEAQAFFIPADRFIDHAPRSWRE